MTTDYQPSDVFHYGMKVEDMDKAIEDWQAIGADVLMAPVEAEGVGVFCAIMLFRGMVFELVAPAADKAQESSDSESMRPGAIDHVAYLSDDIEADLAELKEKGGEVRLPATLNTGFDREMAFIQMPTGLVIELMDRHPKGNRNEDPLAGYHEWRGSGQAA